LTVQLSGPSCPAPMRIPSFVCVAIASLLILSASANVTYNISGSVKNWTPVWGDTPSAHLPYGTTYDATFVYDPDAASVSSTGTQQTYSFVSSSVTFHPAGGDWSTSSDGLNNIVTVRDSTTDQIQFSADATGPNLGTFEVTYLLIVFGGTNLVLGTTDLPDSIDLADWNSDYTSSYLKVYFDEGAASITADITSMSLAGSAVPEPSTYTAIAGATILGFVIMRRRRPGAL